MAYTFIKAKGRVSIFKDGEFDHQQFKGHFAYRNPEAYIDQLIAHDREAAEYRAEQRAARLADVADYLAHRAVRKAQQPELF